MAEKMTERDQFYYGKGYADGKKELSQSVCDILRHDGTGWLEMAENKMEAVAHLFGKEMGKRFTINFYGRIYDVSFDKHGLRVFSDEIFEDELSRLLLEGLIIGNAVIVNE
jgi:hypothetical protein